MEKTNVMRILDQKKVSYTPREYPHGENAPSGVEVAKMTGLDPDTVFKTLVTVGASKKNYVFVIPVASELDLKAAAKAVREKSIAMIRQTELLPLTGYVHGGCSPLGMKKPFPTYFDEIALIAERFRCSAGRRGAQVEVDAEALAALIGAEFADITE